MEAYEVKTAETAYGTASLIMALRHKKICCFTNDPSYKDQECLIHR